MEQKKKKPSKKQLEQMLDNSYLVIPKSKEFQEVSLEDIGITIALTDDWLILSRYLSKVMIPKFVSNGYSDPYQCAYIFMDVYNKYKDKLTRKERGSKAYSVKLEYFNDCGLSHQEKFAVQYFIEYVYSVFENHYMIGEDDTSTVGHKLNYISFVVRNNALIDNKYKGQEVTFNDFLEEYICNYFKAGLLYSLKSNDKESYDEIDNIIDGCFREAYTKIKTAIKDNDGVISNAIAFHKQNEDVEKELGF